MAAGVAVMLATVLLAGPASAQTYGPQPVGITCTISAPVAASLRIACTLSGFGARVRVIITIFSTPRELGSVLTDENGQAAFEVALPADLEPGDHRVEGRALALDGTERLASTLVSIGNAFSIFGSPGAVDTQRAADLPRTGGSTGRLVGAGSLLVAAGGLLVVGARKRRSRVASPSSAGS